MKSIVLLISEYDQVSIYFLYDCPMISILILSDNSFHDVTKPLIWMRFKFYAVDKHNKRSFNRSFSRKLGGENQKGF